MHIDLTSQQLSDLSAFTDVLTNYDRCTNAEADASLAVVLRSDFTARERQAWMAPIKGVWRTAHSGGPCAESLRW